MPNLKDMYRTILKDTFPDTMTITLGDTVLTYKKRTWHIDGETKGLRYGENPDQPAALYQLTSGRLSIDGMEWRMAPNVHCYLDYYQTKTPTKEPMAIGGYVPMRKVYELDPYDQLTPGERAYILPLP